MSQIYECTQSYLDLIKDRTPTPPTPLYFTKTSEVEINVFDEPVKELIIEPESRESTPEYQTVPVKALINTFEQGKSGIASAVYLKHAVKIFINNRTHILRDFYVQNIH